MLVSAAPLIGFQVLLFSKLTFMLLLLQVKERVLEKILPRRAIILLPYSPVFSSQ
jgi:hypothetical protein